MLLLDTHVWLWSIADSRRIGSGTRRVLERELGEDRVRLSPLSLFETASLYTAGRLRLTRSLDETVTAGLDGLGVRLALLTREAALIAGAIPRDAMPDPLDRLLVATARQLDATLVTADRRLLEYASSTSNLRVRDAHR